MSKKEKAPSSVAALNEAAENQTPGKATVSISNLITPPQKKQAVIAPLLSHGAENAIPTRQLLVALGLSDVRLLRSMVAHERKLGFPILATRHSGGGYFLPDKGEKGRQEILQFIATNTAAIASTAAALRAARAALTIVDGQTQIKEG